MNKSTPGTADPVAAQPPTAEALLAKAKELTPFLTAQAAANEQAGRLTDETIAVLVDHGFTGTLMPRCFGGTEAWPLELLEVIEALSYADGSTGWVVMAWEVGMASAAAYLPAETSQTLFGKSLPIIAGQGGAIGRAEATRGGYRLTGNWRYGSGLLHAEYIHTGAIIHEKGTPRLLPGTTMPEARIFILPVSQSEFRGNWDVLGLRGTGSIDYAINDVFVPEEFTHIQTAKRPNQGGDVYRIAIHGMGAICHAGFALGVGRRVLDELAALARMDPSRSALIAQPGGGESFQEQFGLAEAKFRSARAFVREAQGEIQAAVQSGNDPATRQITMARLALNIVTSTVAEVCNFAYKYAGGVALRDSAIQRCLRDMYGGTQHASTAPSILRECARELLGIAPGKVWGPRGLIDPS